MPAGGKRVAATAGVGAGMGLLLTCLRWGGVDDAGRRVALTAARQADVGQVATRQPDAGQVAAREGPVRPHSTQVLGQTALEEGLWAALDDAARTDGALPEVRLDALRVVAPPDDRQRTIHADLVQRMVETAQAGLGEPVVLSGKASDLVLLQRILDAELDVERGVAFHLGDLLRAHVPGSSWAVLRVGVREHQVLLNPQARNLVMPLEALRAERRAAARDHFAMDVSLLYQRLATELTQPTELLDSGASSDDEVEAAPGTGVAPGGEEQ